MGHIEQQVSCYTKSCNAEKMAIGLHNRFGVGVAGCNDGLVFLLAANDREMYISHGKAAEDLFP